MRVLGAMALITVALLAAPALAGAAGANSGGSQYLPSVPGGNGPQPAKVLGPAAVDPDAQSSSSSSADVGPTGAGDLRIGLLFPVLLGLTLLASLAISAKRMRARH